MTNKEWLKRRMAGEDNAERWVINPAFLRPAIISPDYNNPVINAVTPLDLAMLACRLFSSNELPLICIMLNRESKA